MATVAFDDRSFMIDGRRVWLISGAMHYFRTPAALWRDRLTKARRGGLNCIETYVAWNVHEPVEGQWEFSGDNDVAEFIQQAGDLGLYVIVRPGPFICAEWEFGGFPGWLTAKSGVQYRTPNAVYTHYYDKYFRQLLPRLVDLQVSRGGNIIAIANENEYFNTTMPDRMEYLDFISMLYRRAGFDIPILTCNQKTEPRVADAVECVNGWGRLTSQVKSLRHIQPDKPLLATEFWSGWFDAWGGEHATKDPRETARRAFELVGGGAQINYYMYHGGTNFGFYGGRTVGSDHTFITTSYDFDAPIAEGGGLTRKYHLLRLANLLNRHMAPLLAAAAPTPAAAMVGAATTYCRQGPAGSLVVVSNGGDEKITDASVVMPDGRVLQIDLSHFGAAAVCQDATLTDRHVLDYSNLTPLGMFGARLFILHGAPGPKAVVSINGCERIVEVPQADRPTELEWDGLKVLVMNSSTAEHVWDVDGQVVIGPRFAGETLDDLDFDAATRQYYLADNDGSVHMHKVKRSRKSASGAKPPALGRWENVEICSAVTDAADAFKRIDRLGEMSRLDCPLGYGWYRASFDAKRAAKKAIFLPGCEDRAAVFVNGVKAGVWGRGDGAGRRPMTIQLAKGANELTFLVDNLGRFNFGSNMGEPKGMWDDVYVASALRPKAMKMTGGAEKDFSRRIVPRSLQHLAESLRGRRPMVCETSFTLTQAAPVHVQFSDFAHTVAIFCNDHPVGFFPGVSGGFGDVLLKRETTKGVNRIKLLLWPDPTAKDVAAAFRFHRLDDNLTAGARWSFRPWRSPSEPSAEPSAGKGKGLPAWFRTTFKAPKASAGPLFVHICGARKGQLYLNGHNVGRVWSIGPQKAYYLPEPWLQRTNELLLFEEDGKTPIGTELEFKPQGPYS